MIKINQNFRYNVPIRLRKYFMPTQQSIKNYIWGLSSLPIIVFIGIMGFEYYNIFTIYQQLENAERIESRISPEVQASIPNWNRLTTIRDQVENQISNQFTWLVFLTILELTVISITIYLMTVGVSEKIKTVAQEITHSSTEIAATMEQQELMTSQQAASVNQTTTTIDELGATSNTTAEQAANAANGARHALALSQTGTKAVSRTLEGMSILNEKVGAIAVQIVRLSEQTSQIGNIAALVGDLANQTNMLALNAAVEAVRAGEHGKGFAVVAAEIRKLADQSQKSTEKINGLVADIQTAINSTVMVTDAGTKTVEEGVKIAKETAEAFQGVTEAINEIFLSTQQISLSAKQQAVAIQQAIEAMNSLNQVATQTAQSISQVKIGTEKLKEAAQNLHRIS
jgi:methyl-accepting chemotaxis protein